MLQDSRSECSEMQIKFIVTNSFCSSSDLGQITTSGGKENYSEMDQQSAFYSYFNQQLFAPQLFAHQTMMSSWPFHPSFFSGWPLTTPLPYASPGRAFTLTSPVPEMLNNNYVINKNDAKDDDVRHSSTSTRSGSVSPASQMNDSVEIQKLIEKKDPSKSKHFECQTCHKTFGYKHVLQNHEKVHTGEKSYRCPKCDKCFRRDHHLKVHMRLHSGEKPYICTFPMCDRQFVQVANLRRHLKTHDHVNRLKVHEKLLASHDGKSSRPLYASESSEDSLENRRSSQKADKLSEFTLLSSFDNFKSSDELLYESPEQSEPEDLSTKSYARTKEKRN